MFCSIAISSYGVRNGDFYGKSNGHGETWVCESRVSFALSPLLKAAKRARLPASDPLIS
jgi:hypothetical protein